MEAHGVGQGGDGVPVLAVWGGVQEEVKKKNLQMLEKKITFIFLEVRRRFFFQVFIFLLQVFFF